MRKKVPLLVAWIAMAHLAGCATSSGVIANPSASQSVYHSIYIVNHGGSSADMDANMQREFLKHGFAVKAGADDGNHDDAQLIVRYADDWKWDLAMYLWSLDVMVYDSKSGTLIATGRWKNSTFHGFYSSEKIVTQVVDDTLAKANIRHQ
jgi:hypothetical protein